MEAAALPAWVEIVGAAAAFVVTVIIGLWKYFKGATQDNNAASSSSGQSTATVVSASFIDSKLLRELIDALREHQEEMARIIQRDIRSQADLREAVIESNEAVRLQTDATLNMLRFITRQSQLSKP